MENIKLEMLKDVLNFSENIKPIIMKIQNDAKLSKEELQRIKQYYIESTRVFGNINSMLKEESN